MFSSLTQEDLVVGLDAVVDEILAEAHIDSPPIDALVVASRLGIALALDDRQQGRARYVRLADRRSGLPQAAILLRPEPRPERRQWAVAHEIGEHVAHRVFAHWKVDANEISDNAREKAANWLAGRLLLPTASFHRDAAAHGWDLFALKSLYTTASHELIARRMLECPPPVIVTIFDDNRITFRRSNVASRTPPPTQAEIACQAAAHAQIRPFSRQPAGDCPDFRANENGTVPFGSTAPLRVQAWPIHEPDRKREILRTELSPYDADNN